MERVCCAVVEATSCCRWLCCRQTTCPSLIPPPAPGCAELSRKIAQGLFEIQMIDKEGTVLEDPR